MNNSNTKEEIVFADGFKFRRKHANAPDFVLGSLSLKVDDAISFLKANQKNGWVNLGNKSTGNAPLFSYYGLENCNYYVKYFLKQ